MQEAYYIVYKWMHEELKLRCSELSVFAVIYGFTYNGETTYNGSLKWIAGTVGIKKRQAVDVLKKLVKKNLLKKDNLEKNKQKFCEYQVNIKEVERIRNEYRKKNNMEEIESKHEFKLLSKNEVKEIYENLDKYNEKLDLSEKINFICSLYNLKYDDYKEYKEVKKDDIKCFKQVLNELSLTEICLKIKAHLESEKTKKYKEICQLPFIIKNIEGIRVRKEDFLGRLYFKDDFENLEEGFFN